MKFFFAHKKVADKPSSEGAATANVDELIAKGNRLEDANRLDEALETYEEAIRLAPNGFRGHLNLGNLSRRKGNNTLAADHYRRAIELNPDYPGTRLNLGNALMAEQAFNDAADSYRAAIRLRPDWPEAWFGLGCALEKIQPPVRIDMVVEAYQEALRLEPEHGKAVANLVTFLGASGQPETARKLIESFNSRYPENVPALLIRAAMEREQGYLDASFAAYTKIMSIAPEHEAANYFLWTMNFIPDVTAETVLSAHLAYGERVLKQTLPCPRKNARDPERRLKIGYVSPDFRGHPISCFIEPLLRQHDRSAVEVYCYYNYPIHDEMTRRLVGLADHWRDIADVPDDVVVRTIMADDIDILVDLAGHTADNRLGLFARKPAPIQCTWLGYLGTTGLRTIDYRLCDAHTDPSPEAESWQVETPLRLPDSQWCYQPQVALPEPSPLPRLTNGYWTFGSPNQASKLNDVALRTWAELLVAIPDSRLRILGVTDTVFAERIRSGFAARGIAPNRIDVAGRIPIEQYFAFYREIDIALDTFPYNGATTTCDALVMGVPVATVAGKRAIARGGVSLLNTIGLQKWIAPSQTEFVPMLLENISDPARMSALRAELPKWMRASALMDVPKFTKNVESLYRSIWRRACAESTGS